MAFCLQCGAPQIRVSGLRPQPENRLPAEDPADQPTGSQTDTIGGITPAAEYIRYGQPAGVRWPDAARSALLAGILLTLAMSLPYVAPLAWFFVATVGAGGFVTALYAWRTRQALTPARGARLGMLGGLTGWIASVTICVLTLLLGGAQLTASLRAALLQKLATSSDPRAQEVLSSPGGMTTILVLSMLVLLVIALACSALGGVVAAKLLGKGADRKR